MSDNDIVLPQAASTNGQVSNQPGIGELIGDNPQATGAVAAGGTLIVSGTVAALKWGPPWLKFAAGSLLAASTAYGVGTAASAGARNTKYENIAINALMGYPELHKPLKVGNHTFDIQNEAQYIQYVMVKAKGIDGKQLLKNHSSGDPTVMIYLADANTTVRPDPNVNPQIFVRNKQEQPIIIDSELTEKQFAEKEQRARDIQKTVKDEFNKTNVVTRGLQGSLNTAAPQQRRIHSSGNVAQDFMNGLDRAMPVLAPILGIGGGLLIMAVTMFSGTGLALGGAAIIAGLFHKQIGDGIAAVSEKSKEESKADPVKTADNAATSPEKKVAQIIEPSSGLPPAAMALNTKGQGASNNRGVTA